MSALDADKIADRIRRGLDLSPLTRRDIMRIEVFKVIYPDFARDQREGVAWADAPAIVANGVADQLMSDELPSIVDQDS